MIDSVPRRVKQPERVVRSDICATLKPPRYPKGLTTCRALVLATLLAPGEFDTVGMFPPGAISLHVVMRALARRYRWPIVRIDAATGTGWATTYSLPSGVIEALDHRGRVWLDGVRAVHAKRLHPQHGTERALPTGSR